MKDIVVILGFTVFTTLIIIALLYLGRSRRGIHIFVAILFSIGTIVGVWGWLLPAFDPMREVMLWIYAATAGIAIPTVFVKALHSS